MSASFANDKFAILADIFFLTKKKVCLFGCGCADDVTVAGFDN